MATVTKAAAEKLFTALGKEGVENWSEIKLVKRLNKISEFVDEEKDVPDECEALLETLLTCNEKGEEITLTDEDEPEEPEETEETAEEEKDDSEVEEDEDLDIDEDGKVTMTKNPETKGKKKVKTVEKKATKPTKVIEKSKVDGKTKLKRQSTGAGRGYRILDYSSTGVIHWMAVKGMDFTQAKRVLKHYKLDSITDANLKSRLAVGRDKKRSKAASVTKEHAIMLTKVAGSAGKAEKPAKKSEKVEKPAQKKSKK